MCLSHDKTLHELINEQRNLEPEELTKLRHNMNISKEYIYTSREMNSIIEQYGITNEEDQHLASQLLIDITNFKSIVDCLRKDGLIVDTSKLPSIVYLHKSKAFLMNEYIDEYINLLLIRERHFQLIEHSSNWNIVDKQLFQLITDVINERNEYKTIENDTSFDSRFYININEQLT